MVSFLRSPRANAPGLGKRQKKQEKKARDNKKSWETEQ